MNERGLTFVIIELLLGCFAVFCIAMMIGSRRTPHKKQIAVIVEDSESDVWVPLKEGAKEAARENNVDIRFVTTGTFDNAADQVNSVDEAVNDGCNALLVVPVNDRAAWLIKKKNYRIPVLLLISDSSCDMKSISIDPREAGKKLAEMIMDDTDGALTVGFLTDRHGSRLIGQIRKETASILEKAGYKEAFTKEGADQKFIKAHRSDILVCLTEESLSAAADLAGQKRLSGVDVYGFGFATEDVYQLDMENIKGLAYPDIFRTGYYGVKEMTARLNGDPLKPKSRVIRTRSLRKEDIFENKEIMYIISRRS